MADRKPALGKGLSALIPDADALGLPRAWRFRNSRAASRYVFAPFDATS